jgi:hypothetical protein
MERVFGRCIQRRHRFRVDSPSHGKGTLNVLVAFKPNRFSPVGVDALILGKSGQLYGATASGGAYLNGSIFELIPNNGKWTEQLLFSFKDRTDAGVAGWKTHS